MSDEPGLGGRDEPARGTDDHAELLSELDSHDLATAMSVSRTTAADVFEADEVLTIPFRLGSGPLSVYPV